jgi:hypothetical protein
MKSITVGIQTVPAVTCDTIVSHSEQESNTHEAELRILIALSNSVSGREIGLVVSIGRGNHVRGLDSAASFLT